MSGRDLLEVRCAAKINLYLAVTGKREDGYHDIETYFQPVSLYDVIELSEIERGIILSGDGESIFWDESNLCYKAAEQLFKYVDFTGGVMIRVRKSIPPRTGLGGGSSNAAGVLTGLNEYFKFGLSKDQLMRLAVELGSDVPFFIFGKPAIGRGRGEVLEEAEGLKSGKIILVFPSTRISTAEAFKKLNLMLTKSESGYKLKRLIEELNRFPGPEFETYNSFMASVVGSYPEVAEIFDLLEREEKAIFYSLSGSGSACFIVYGEEEEALAALNRLSGKGHNGLLVEPVNWTIGIG